MDYQQIKIEKDVKKCPQCGKVIEWCGGKVDDSQQEYNCNPCRINIKIGGWTEEDQETVASMAFD